MGRVGGQEGQAAALVTTVPRVRWSCVVVCVSVCVSWLGILIDVCAGMGPISEDDAGAERGAGNTTTISPANPLPTKRAGRPCPPGGGGVGEGNA